MVVKEGHTYLRTHRLSGKLLQFELLDEIPALLDRARTTRTGRTAKTLVKQGPFRITIVAMRKGATMDKHHVDGPISIQVLRGRIQLGTAERTTDFGPGGRGRRALGRGRKRRRFHDHDGLAQGVACSRSSRSTT
jgi:hypothetical protein